MKPSAFRIERLLAKVEAEVVPPPRQWLRARRYAFHPDEVAEAKRKACPTWRGRLRLRERTLAQVEGWKLGVPGLIRAGKGRDVSGASATCVSGMFRLH